MVAAPGIWEKSCAQPPGTLGFDDCVCSCAQLHHRLHRSGATGRWAPCPRPTCLLACNNGCGTMFKWYEVLSRRFGVPLLFLDTPYCSGPSPQPRDQRLPGAASSSACITDLEGILGSGVDRDKIVGSTLKLSIGHRQVVGGNTGVCAGNRPLPLELPGHVPAHGADRHPARDRDRASTITGTCSHR